MLKKFLRFAAIGLCLMPGPAAALNVQIFEPMNDGTGVMTIFRSHGLKAKEWQLGAVANFDINPLEYGNIDDTRVDDIVNWWLTTDLSFAYGVRDWLTLQTSMPLHFWNDIEPILGGTEESEVVRPGELRFSAIFRLRDSQPQGERQIGLGLAPFISLPTADADYFVGNGAVSGGLRLVVDRYLTARDYLSLNFAYRIRPEEVIYNLLVDDDLHVGGAYEHRFGEKRPVNLFLEVHAATVMSEFLKDEESNPVDFQMGLKWWFVESQRWLATLGVGRGVNNGYGAPDWRPFIGLSYLFKPQTKVQPVTAPEPAPVVSAQGNLRVVVQDEKAQALVATIQRKAQVDASTAEFSGVQWESALPAGDYEITAFALGFEKSPVIPVRIEKDRSETVTLTLKALAAKIVGDRIVVDPVYFDTNRDTIKTESFNTLKTVAKVLLEYPQIKKIRIEGHTDSKSSLQHNMDLSRRRAASVRRYLVSEGVPAEKLESAGFGPTKPIADNATVEGRARNRRVDFVILEQ